MSPEPSFIAEDSQLVQACTQHTAQVPDTHTPYRPMAVLIHLLKISYFTQWKDTRNKIQMITGGFHLNCQDSLKAVTDTELV